jgi:PAS domain S-box-containing protein
MKNITLLQRFSIVALIVMIAVALAFGYLVNHILEKGMIEHMVRNTHVLVQSNIVKHYSPEELLVPMTGEEHEIFLEEIKHLSLGLDIQTIKVWNRDMVVVWSNDRQMTGKQFPDNEDLKKAFAGETVLITKDADEIRSKYLRNGQSGNLMEMYLPIKFESRNEIGVVIELYKNIDPFIATIAGHRHVIWLWTCVSFVTLFIFLFGWFRKASRRIDFQTGEMIKTVGKLEGEIAERERFESLLKKASKEWRKIFDSTRDMIIMLDDQLNIVRTNLAAVNFFKKPFKEVLGKHISSLFNSMEMSDSDNPISAMMDGKDHEETEIYFPEKRVWIAISMDPILNKQGNVTGAVLAMRDVTEIKRMQDSMVTAKNDWEDTFDTITDMITIHDKDFNILRANRAAQEMFNLHSNTGKCYQYYHGTDSPPPRCPSCECLNTGEFASFERFEPHLDRFVEIRAIPRFNNENEIIGTIHIVRDITDVKTASEEKNKLREQLLHVQKMDSIGRIAGGVAHDFNNIVSVIIGYSELALKELREGDSLKDNISAIHGAGEKAAALTRKLLAFSRKQVLEMKAVDMERIIENMTKMLKRLIPENVTLLFDSQAHGQKVLADPTQMEQILMNLVVNARDAMPDGGQLKVNTSEVDLDEKQVADKANLKPGSYLRLSVTDTGIGMSSEVQDKIFEPFFSTKDVGKGTGMGLATVYGIVNQHNGYIEVQSEPGKGSKFSIYLPVTEGETEEIEEHQPERILTGDETILVVDDESQLRDIIIGMLKPLGYRVFGAANGEEALQISDEFSGRIDLLLTDVIMPGMNGKKLAEILTGKRPETKVIFISGYTDDAIARHGVLEEGIVLIQKPITEKILTSRIREVLDADKESKPVCPEKVDMEDIHLLVADDNEDILRLIKVYLKDHDCEIDAAENGEVAVDKFKQGKHDIVLMDMQMPVMDGLTATQQIRDWEKENKKEQSTIIALTGNATAEDINRCLEAGATSHLAKPMSRDQLITALFSFAPSRHKNVNGTGNGERDRVLEHIDADLKELIPDYLEERQGDINKIQEALEAADYETVRILGHTLKGSGGGYGFEPISEAGFNIEEAAKQENEEVIKRWVNKLSEYLDSVEVVYE